MNPALTTLPQELLPVIAAFVPLRSAPGTLRALALGNHRFYNICRPILYSRLILRNEDHVIGVIQRIIDEPQLGLSVTELYIMSELSVATLKGKKPFDVVAGLQMLVTKGLIPRLVALGLYLLKDWTYDKDFEIILRGRLLSDFWINLRNECPRLRTLILRNVGQSFMDPWITGPVVDEISSLPAILRLEWRGEELEEKEDLMILNNLPLLASSLHTLSLRSGFREATVLLSLDFPHLKLLRLQNFLSANDTEKVQGFFKRHPQLESLSLEDSMHTWFPDDIGVGFLPNLKHLKARFEDIRLLVAILPQLVSLGFTTSYNGQDVRGWQDHTLEGVLWYETLDGEFRTEENRKKVEGDFMNGYMHSIVRGAPNLEELGLHGMALSSASLRILSLTLCHLVKLERFYYRGFSPDPNAKALARVCPRLESVTSISGRDLPDPTILSIPTIILPPNFFSPSEGLAGTRNGVLPTTLNAAGGPWQGPGTDSTGWQQKRRIHDTESAIERATTSVHEASGSASSSGAGEDADRERVCPSLKPTWTKDVGKASKPTWTENAIVVPESAALE
ncbi:hypothetical protein BJ912DRAFT_1067632 [Pholiota molesta]|nr:hypothetical protein BJ912DRAFT_1067632 [Pholiota molesta]